MRELHLEIPILLELDDVLNDVVYETTNHPSDEVDFSTKCDCDYKPDNCCENHIELNVMAKNTDRFAGMTVKVDVTAVNL